MDRIRSEIGSEIQEGKSIVAKLVIIRLIESPEISRAHQRVVPRLFYTEAIQGFTTLLHHGPGITSKRSLCYVITFSK